MAKDFQQFMDEVFDGDEAKIAMIREFMCYLLDREFFPLKGRR